MGHEGSPSSSLAVHYRPVQTPEEQLELEAGLDALIGMALRKIVEERKYKDATRRGNDPILLELSSMVRE